MNNIKLKLPERVKRVQDRSNLVHCIIKEVGLLRYSTKALSILVPNDKLGVNNPANTVSHDGVYNEMEH